MDTFINGAVYSWKLKEDLQSVANNKVVNFMKVLNYCRKTVN